MMSKSTTEASSTSSYRQLTPTLLREGATRLRSEASGLEQLAKLIERRGEVFGDGREDPEPLWWAFFLKVLR